MIRLRMELKEKGLTGKRLREEFKAIKSAALQELGEHFHRTNLPRRFTESGGRFLGFQKRSARYTARKMRKYRHRDPLVWSGASKILALGIQDVRVLASGNRSEVRIVIHARGLNRRNASSTIRMADEVRTISPREFGPLTRVLDRGVQKRIKERDQ